MTTLLSTEELYKFLVNQRDRFLMDMVDLCNELVEQIDSEINRINNINKMINKIKFGLHNGMSKESALEYLHLQRKLADNLKNNIIAYKDKNTIYPEVTLSDIDEVIFKTYIGDIKDCIEDLLYLYRLSYKRLYDININIYTRKATVQYINESDIIETQKFPIITYHQQTTNKDKVGLVYKIGTNSNNYKYIYLMLTTLAEKESMDK